jgi:HD-GYP domain-containing protein (c-di-GMP phosphodiesterase class II)
MAEPRPAGRPGPDDETAFDRSLGAQLLSRLHGLLRTARLYDLTNQALRDQIEDMLRLLGRATDGELVLVAMGQCFYLNGTRLRAEPSQVAMFEALSREFEVRRVGGLRFLDGLGAEELGAFIRVMSTHAEGERALRFAQAVADAGVLRVVPVSLNELGALARDLEQDSAEDDTSERGRARQTYDRAVRGARGALLRTARTGKPPIRRVKRLVQPVVDSIMKNEYSIVGLTALRNHDEYTYAHCVNVSVLSIAMGQRLGLSRTELADLGVAGLLHDVGKLTVPPDVLGKPGRLSAEERDLMQRHPLEGLKLVARMPGLSALTAIAMEVCLLHHRHWKGDGGYPAIARPCSRAGYASIVSVADCFDAMTAHRAYRARPFTGYEALQQLLGREREHFDPAALWALVRTIGLYPAGTVMLTLSGHMVLSLSPDPAVPTRPFCRVLSRPDGSMPDEHENAVWQPMPAHESVARVVTPEEFDFEVDQLLAA